MSPREFAEILSTYGHLFQPIEMIEINQLIAIEEFEPKIFMKKQRNPFENIVLNGTDIICKRILLRLGKCTPYHIKDLEVTTITVNEPLFLTGLNCNILQIMIDNDHDLCFDLREDLATEIEIAQVSEESPEKILSNQNAKLNRDRYTDIFLNQPILIRPLVNYEIRMKQTPPGNCVTRALLKSKVQLDSSVTVKFHRDASVEGDSIPRRLVFCLKFMNI